MRTLEVSDETYEKIKSQLGEEVKEITSLDDLVGQTLLFHCARYFYYGRVKKVTPHYIQLEKAAVVFETGDYSSNKPVNRESLPHGALVMRASIEAILKLDWK